LRVPKIDITVNVSKAFYDVLATTQQIKVSEEDILRLRRSLRDAQSLYNAGLADKTDFKRATIALNNALAGKKSNEEILKAKMEYLKNTYGIPRRRNLQYCIRQPSNGKNEFFIDTIQAVSYTNRIEYQMLATQRNLQQANLKNTINGVSSLPFTLTALIILIF